MVSAPPTAGPRRSRAGRRRRARAARRPAAAAEPGGARSSRSGRHPRAARRRWCRAPWAGLPRANPGSRTGTFQILPHRPRPRTGDLPGALVPGGVGSGPWQTWTSSPSASARTPSTTSPPGTSSARSTPTWSPTAARTPCCSSSTRRSSPPASAPSRTSDRSTRRRPVIDVDRGGKITFHGPGQLVGYPIVRLPDHVHVVDYVRRRRGGADPRLPRPRGDDRARARPQRRLAARGRAAARSARSPRIGIRVSRGVTMHGFALNCDVDLGWYDRFVPCGIADAGVTSLSAELGRDVTVAEVAAGRRAAPARPAGAGRRTPPTPDYEPRPDPARGAALICASRVLNPPRRVTDRRHAGTSRPTREDGDR